MLVLELQPDDAMIYVSHGQDGLPVGRIRFRGFRNGRIVATIEGSKDEFGVFREKALKKRLGQEAFDRLIGDFLNGATPADPTAANAGCEGGRQEAAHDVAELRQPVLT